MSYNIKICCSLQNAAQYSQGHWFKLMCSKCGPLWTARYHHFATYFLINVTFSVYFKFKHRSFIRLCVANIITNLKCAYMWYCTKLREWDFACVSGNPIRPKVPDLEGQSPNTWLMWTDLNVRYIHFFERKNTHFSRVKSQTCTCLNSILPIMPEYRHGQGVWTRDILFHAILICCLK